METVNETALDGPAYSDPRPYLIFFVLVATSLPLDLYSKGWAFERFHRRDTEELSRMTIIPNLLEFKTVLNTGALFGIGQGQQWFFVSASVCACFFVLYLFATSGRRQWITHIALALVISGALGNLYDRITVRLDVANLRGNTRTLRGFIDVSNDGFVNVETYPRRDPYPTIRVDQLTPFDDGQLVHKVTAVRDFIHINWTFGKRAPWPWIFNLADVYLVVGVGMLVIQWYRESRNTPREEPAEERELDDFDRAFFEATEN